MMALIYSCATTVLIWLGQDCEGVATSAFKEVKHQVERVGNWPSLRRRLGASWITKKSVRWMLRFGRASKLSSGMNGSVAFGCSRNSVCQLLLGRRADIEQQHCNIPPMAELERLCRQYGGQGIAYFMPPVRNSVWWRHFVVKRRVGLSRPSARNAAVPADQTTRWDTMKTGAFLVMLDYKKTVDEVYGDIALALIQHHVELEPLTLVFHSESTLASDTLYPGFRGGITSRLQHLVRWRGMSCGAEGGIAYHLDLLEYSVKSTLMRSHFRQRV
ncbi:hypothetical protein F4818DRAFT_390943 [Hypoxylon cercidicola]|nr:hypothetical protein F4818DRAFT_390943 [Hypoxylon cercidicola]